jgi:hypothetical protein
MNETESLSPEILLWVSYDDRPDLIEISTSVRDGSWRGLASAYTSPAQLIAAAEELLQWVDRPIGKARIEGSPSLLGSICLSFYTIDKAGHLVCHVQLATGGSTNGRESAIRRMSLEMNTEAGLVEKFAKDVMRVARGELSLAVLGGVS